MIILSIPQPQVHHYSAPNTRHWLSLFLAYIFHTTHWKCINLSSQRCINTLNELEQNLFSCGYSNELCNYIINEFSAGIMRLFSVINEIEERKAIIVLPLLFSPWKESLKYFAISDSHLTEISLRVMNRINTFIMHENSSLLLSHFQICWLHVQHGL